MALAARREFALPAANEGSHRADGFAWWSGPNSAETGDAFAGSRSRRLQGGDVVLLHANSYLDGYWTDITRTFICGDDEPHREIFAAVEAARETALSDIRPGVPAKDVDGIARQLLGERGFAQYFTHGLGHEIGFESDSCQPSPRLHPESPDILETGMVFNVEPAVYLPNNFRGADTVM